MLCGLRMPRPEPIGAASGITAAQPASSSCLQVIGSSEQYGRTDEALLDQHARGLERRLVVGEERLVADDLELDELGHAELAREPRACAPPRRRCSSRRCSAAARTPSSDRSRAAKVGPGFRSTRRSATVTISAPDAASAARVSSTILVLAGADDEPRAAALAGERKGSGTQQVAPRAAGGGCQPPPTNVTISTWSPSASARVGPRTARGRPRDCARRRPARSPTPSCSSSAATVRPVGQFDGLCR